MTDPYKTRLFRLLADWVSKALRLALDGCTDWEKRFYVGQRCGTNASQNVPADYSDLIHHFRTSVIAFRKSHNLEPAHNFCEHGSDYVQIRHVTLEN